MQAQIKGGGQGDEPEQRPAVSLVEMFLRAKELERKGCDVIHFDAGEPDFNPPEQVVEATIRALKEGKGRYTESAGIPEAKKAIANKLNKKYNQGIGQEQILITAGGRLALYYAFMALSKKSTVGIITPDWPAYRDLSHFMSLPIQYFKTSLDNGWNVNLDEVSRSECSALILNFPNNPTGKILDVETFEKLVQIANEKGMTIISDEVYSDYVLDPSKRFKSILEVPGTKYVFLTSLSKSYAMTGFRAGYVVSDPKTISMLTKLNGLIVTSMPEFVQYAVIAAMDCDDYVRDKVRLIKSRRDAAARALTKYLGAEFYLSDGSMYMFPKLHTSNGTPFNSEKFALDLLEKQHVSVTPGTSFGSWFKEHVRITLLSSEDRIREGIERMSRLL